MNQLFASRLTPEEIIPNQFRIGLYPFIQYLYELFSADQQHQRISRLVTINYAAANLATQLDTNMNANLGSGGTHFDNAFNSMNTTDHQRR